MKNLKKISIHYIFVGILFSLFAFSSCGYEKNETDYENEIEAAENEVGDPMLRNDEGIEDDTIYDSDQPARIDGQEGHHAPATDEDIDYQDN